MVRGKLQEVRGIGPSCVSGTNRHGAGKAGHDQSAHSVYVGGMSWWDTAYRSGRVPWDAGEFDRHLPAVLGRLQLASGRVFDAGCGNGKSAVWLAENGFEVIGVDQSAPAIEQARRRAVSRGTHERTRFIVARFPDEVASADLKHTLAPASFDLVIERAFLQHVGSRQALKRTVGILAELLTVDGALFSLMIASEGMAESWGITRWSRREVRRALEPVFVIEEMYLDVFTPGKPGSVPAWVTPARPGHGRPPR